MKKKTSFKLFKALSIICIVSILISFASLSASADGFVFLGSLDSFTVVSSSNVNVSTVQHNNVNYIRLNSPSGGSGLRYMTKLTRALFEVGHTYNLRFSFQSSSNRSQVTFFLSNSDDPNAADVTCDIGNLRTERYPSGSVQNVIYSFQIPSSFNGQDFYLWVLFNAPLSGSTTLDISPLTISDPNPIPSDWESPSYNIEDPDLAEPVSNFQNSTEELLQFDWFGSDSPIYRGTRGFMALFNTFYSAVSNSEYDYLNVIPYLITFALFIGLLGLILNTVSHIAIDNNDVASKHRSRSHKDPKE